MRNKVAKIVSGGQTGADRAAFDVAIELNMEYGGYVPAGRLAEDGEIPDKYAGLVETVSSDPADRTRLNVLHSDATLLITRGTPAGGSKFTVRAAHDLQKPLLRIDLSRINPTQAASAVNLWLETTGFRTLNIAGPRASEDKNIYSDVLNLLTMCFRK